MLTFLMEKTPGLKEALLAFTSLTPSTDRPALHSDVCVLLPKGFYPSPTSQRAPPPQAASQRALPQAAPKGLPPRLLPKGFPQGEKRRGLPVPFHSGLFGGSRNLLNTNALKGKGRWGQVGAGLWTADCYFSTCPGNWKWSQQLVYSGTTQTSLLLRLGFLFLLVLQLLYP